ncbi:MAG: methytransferase partner Trm112 [Archaeoglobaceae archaeon]
MRRSLLDILACPKCKSDLELEVLEQENDEIITGKLICRKCETSYPIEDGIPNLLPQL